MDKQNSCNNCKYFAWHYVKVRDRFLSLDKGHCTNWRYTKKIPTLCALWEDLAELKEERKLLVREYIAFIATRLNELVLLIQDDGSDP